jgi:hypothetical protein
MRTSRRRTRQTEGLEDIRKDTQKDINVHVVRTLGNKGKSRLEKIQGIGRKITFLEYCRTDRLLGGQKVSLVKRITGRHKDMQT